MCSSMHLFPGFILWKSIYKIKKKNSQVLKHALYYTLPIIYRKEDYFNNC